MNSATALLVRQGAGVVTRDREKIMAGHDGLIMLPRSVIGT
jgi:hypothetical protein